MKTKKKRIPTFFLVLLFSVVILGVISSFSTALSNLDQGRTEAARLQLEDSIRKAAISGYATDGVYPPTLDYLKKHYGIQIDESRYSVYYSIFAENLMPDITVLDHSAGSEE